MKNRLFFGCLISICFFGCYKAPEMTLEEIEEYKKQNQNLILEQTVSRPYKSEAFKNGQVGGVWNTTISADPKSFNLLIAERDGETTSILSPLVDYLFDYDCVQKKWVSRTASFLIKTNEEKDKMSVFCTLRDDLYWSFYNSEEKIKVTSDDVIFWYNEICGDEEMGSSAYNGQFMETKDGKVERVTIEKIDDLNFVFHFPRIIAEPILHINMDFGPAFIYQKAKNEGGVEGVKNLHSVQTDPKTIPSLGEYFIAEYVPGQRIVYERNPNYWRKSNYPQKKIARIISDNNTQNLLFTKGELETFSPTPEQLNDLVAKANNNFDFYGNYLKKKSGYTVFNAEGSQSASFWIFNQNPKNKDKVYYKWFCKKEFRQAMSCLLNRERIINQTYRGLATPKYSFFPEANAFYDSSIELKYKFDHEHAQELLKSSGFSKKADGFLYDSENNKVEFDLVINATSTVVSDIAQIICDECKKEGITINVRQTDFQRLVEQLTSTYDWQSLIIGFGGDSIFPTQGSNVWVSAGNLHLWYPLQKSPATDWEARVDYLYNKASCIVDKEKAFPLWKEYQEIFLEQCPIVYLVCSRSFFGIQNRWDFSNVYYDNINGAEISHVFMQE